MSLISRFGSVSRIRRSIVLAVGILLAAPIVSAGPQLWLYPKGEGPRQGGHVVPPGFFTLVIENRGKASDANIAHAVDLVIAVEDPSAVTALELVYDGEQIVLDPEGWDVGIPPLPCSDRQMARHGVYPAAFLQVVANGFFDFGDLRGGDTVEIDVTVNGDDDLRVHFDATATGYKTTAQGVKCFDISNPSGHDVTVANRRGGGQDCGLVRISKTGDSRHIDVGDTVEFIIEIANEGSCDLTDRVLRDFIPAVEDENGNPFPAFTVVSTDPPSPSVWNDYLLEWDLISPLPVGERDVVRLLVEFNEPLAEGERVVNRACVSAAELRKRRCAAAWVMVGNPNGDEGPASPGFWCHAVRWVLENRPKLSVSGEELLAWLEEVDFLSEVFSEEYPIFFEEEPEATLAAAADLLCTPQFAVGAADRLARHFLVLWLNVVSGRLAEGQLLSELCEGDEIMPPDIKPETVGALIVAVEEALLAPADDEQLTYWSEVVDAVNNSLVPGEYGCTAPRRLSGRQRAGHGRPGAMAAVSKTRD